jgi:hypothetical protein
VKSERTVIMAFDSALSPAVLNFRESHQIEIYFSVIQRKVLTPNDFDSLAQLETALLAFQDRYEGSAALFQWTFTRQDLVKLMSRLDAKSLAPAA